MALNVHANIKAIGAEVTLITQKPQEEEVHLKPNLLLQQEQFIL